MTLAVIQMWDKMNPPSPPPRGAVSNSYKGNYSVDQLFLYSLSQSGLLNYGKGQGEVQGHNWSASLSLAVTF